MTRRFAGALVSHEGRLALVRERHEHWGGAFWNVPSGAVEEHETPAEGAARELLEETGIVVRPEALSLVGTSVTLWPDHRSAAWNFTATVDSPLLAVADPDGLVLEARWFTRDEAVALLRLLPYRPLSEPLVAHLEGAERGGHWRYDAPEADPVVGRPDA